MNATIPKYISNRIYDKLYVKWKGYDISFNKLIFKKDIVIQNGLFC